MIARLSSLSEVAVTARRDGRLSAALRDFLDGFYADPRLEKLCDEPAPLAGHSEEGAFADACLAAVCDHLCRQYRLPTPAWTKSPSRVLEHPHFAAKSHALRMVHLQESPTAFKQRNIFVSANILSRA